MSLNVTRICRVCLIQNGPMRFINVEGQHPIPNFAQFFTLLTSLQVDHDNEMTNKICQQCFNRVLDAHKLRDLALASDAYLRFRVNQENTVPLETNCADDPSLKINNNLVKNISEDKPRLSIQDHICPTCSKQFKYESEMQRHQHTHTPKFKCATCNKVFGFKSSLLRHAKQHTRGGTRRRCPDCRSTFLDDALLQRHIQYAHKEKKHACSKCDARFGSASALRSHTLTHADKALCCQHCDKTFSLRHQLLRHEALHNGVKKYFCDECGKGFIQKHHLESHMVSHRPERRVTCPVHGCDKMFVSKYAMGRHVHLLHSKDGLLCSACGECFASLRRLEKHLTRCQPGTVQSPSSQKLACHICKKVFTKKYLKKHQLACYEKAFEPSKNKTKDTHKTDDLQNDDTNLVRIVEDIANMMEHQEEKAKLSLEIPQRNVEELGSERSAFGTCENQVKSAFHEHRDKVIECPPKRLITNIEEVLKSGCSDCDACFQSFSQSEETSEMPKCPPNNLPISNESVPNLLHPRCSHNFEHREDISKTSAIAQTNVNEAFNSERGKDASCCRSFPKETNQRDVQVKSDIRDDVQANDCKGILGKCIVTSADGSGEECICAKVGHSEDPLPEYLTTPLLVALEQQGYYPD